MSDLPISSESLYALGVLRHDKDDERQALEAAANRAIDESEQALWPRALQWYENLAFLCGNHLTRFYLDSGGALGTWTFGVDDAHDADRYIAQVSDNRLVRPFETVIGMLTQGRPSPQVAEAGDQPEDEDAAKIASLMIELLFENPLDMPERRREMAGLMLIAGSCFPETLYGETGLPEIVPKFKLAERETAFRDDDGRPIAEEIVEQDGEEVRLRRDFQCRVWSPFHFAADPRATSMEDALWFRRNTFEDLHWIKERFGDGRKSDGFYPEVLEELGSVTPSKWALWWWSRFQDLLDAPQSMWGGSTYGRLTEGVAPNQTLFTVFDVRPTLSFPRGRTLVMAGRRLLYCGDARSWSSRYPWRWHPYSAAHWLKIPGRFLGIPMLSLLVPLQKRINAVDALVRLNREFMSIGQWAYARQHKIKEGTIGGIAGRHIEYQGVPNMPPPTKVQNMPLPAELLKEREDLIQAIDTISSAGMVAGDVAASAARAGVILEFLNEERLRSKGPMIQGYEKAVERIGQNLLIDAQMNLTSEDKDLTERLRVAAKRHGSLPIQSFTGASIADHHAVRIDIASELFNSPQAKKAIAMEVVQFLGPDMDAAQRNAVFRYLGLDELVVSTENASVERARRMVAAIKSGAPENEIPPGMPGVDQPAAMAPVFQAALLDVSLADLPPESQAMLYDLFEHYSAEAAAEAQRIMQARMAMEQAMGAKKPVAQEGG